METNLTYSLLMSLSNEIKEIVYSFKKSGNYAKAGQELSIFRKKVNLFGQEFGFDNDYVKAIILLVETLDLKVAESIDLEQYR